MPSDELDMVNRDPNNLNDNVKVLFEDVIGEPEGAHSADCVWRLAYKCFTGGKTCCYTFLTFICAVPLALCWGCEFAMISFEMIWQWTPCLRVCQIYLGCGQKMLSALLNCCLTPICESCGTIFSKVNISKRS